MTKTEPAEYVWYNSWLNEIFIYPATPGRWLHALRRRKDGSYHPYKFYYVGIL